MNFGLLCDDPTAGPLLNALQRHPDHHLTLAVLVGPGSSALVSSLSGVKCVDQWEELLASRDVDAVIVGGTAPDVWTGAKQLASAEIPLLIFPNLAAGETVLYELSLIRDDSHVVLFPAWSQRFCAAAQQLPADRSKITFVEWQRSVPTGAANGLTNRVIEDALLPDADLLRCFCGDVDQVTSLRLGESTSGVATQTVKLSGRNFPETTWNIKSSDADVSRITFQTGAGPIHLDRNAIPDGASEPVAEHQLLDAFAQTVAGDTNDDGWGRVLKALEIVDASRRSLTRRRTIDLHHEQLSERAIFKTQMAAMGCGVLLLTLTLMLGYLALASVVPLSGWMLKLLRVLIFAPLFGFLVMQLLLPLTRPAK